MHFYYGGIFHVQFDIDMLDGIVRINISAKAILNISSR
jgi:hypothetical protein